MCEFCPNIGYCSVCGLDTDYDRNMVEVLDDDFIQSEMLDLEREAHELDAIAQIVDQVQS